MLSSAGQTSPPPIAPDQLLGELFESVKDVLPDETQRRYGLPMTLLHTEKVSKDDGSRSGSGPRPQKARAGIVTSVHSRRVGVVSVPCRLIAGHVGGNVYEIQCSVDDDANTWEYAESSSDSRARPLAVLAERIITFCLSTIEKRTGRILLKSCGAAPTNGPSDDDTTADDPAGERLLPEADVLFLPSNGA